MMTLSEWMKIVEGTQAMHEVSKRFGLGQPDLHKAVEALTPAFMLGGLKFAPSMPNIQNPFAAILEQKDLKEAIAHQAAMLSGLNEKLLVDIMPSVATAMADAMENIASKSGLQTESGTPSEAFGTALGGMMAAMMGLAPSKDEKKPQTPTEIGMKAMEDWMSFGKSAQSDYFKAFESIFSAGRKSE
jgi:hypothetical protein